MRSRLRWRRRAAVGRLADAVEHAAEQAGADGQMQRLADEADADVAQAEPAVDSSTSTTMASSIERGDAPELGRLALAPDLHRLVEADFDIAPQEQQGAVDGGRRAGGR